MAKEIQVSPKAVAAPTIVRVFLPKGHAKETALYVRTIWDAKLTPNNRSEGLWLKKSVCRSISKQKDGSYIVEAPEHLFFAYNYKTEKLAPKAPKAAKAAPIAAETEQAPSAE